MDVFLGFIAAFGFKFAPRNWSPCAGQLMAISQNTALFSLLSDFYGGDSRTVYGLPELRGRAPIGYGQSPGLPAFPIGLKYGTIQTALSVDELPQHTHNATVMGGGGTPATGSLKASTVDANHGQPVAGDYIACISAGRGVYTNSFASPDVVGSKLVDIAGLTVQGGGGGTPSVTNSMTGQGEAFSIMQPILAINYCIATQGIYPPQN